MSSALALWLFTLVVVVKAGIALGHHLHLARRWILLVKPIARTGTPPGIYINLVLLVLMIVGLALSLRSRADLPLHQ